MDNYLKIPADVLDTSVSVNIDASIREVANLLSLIAMGEQLGIVDDSELSSVYDQIFEVVVQYGYVDDGGSDD